MPNHLHGILFIKGVGRQGDEPRRNVALHSSALEQFGKPRPGSLATILRLFKQAVTRQVQAGESRAAPLWQRNYYEHIIRSPAELERIRAYIRQNPLRWACDRYNPEQGVLVKDASGKLMPWET